MGSQAAGTRLCGRLHASAWPLLLLVAALAGSSLSDRSYVAARSSGRASASSMPGTPGGRRSLRQQQCGICPADAAAASTCALASAADKKQLLRTAIQFCSELAFSPASCCVSMPTSNPQQWSVWSACLWWVLPPWPRAEFAFYEEQQGLAHSCSSTKSRLLAAGGPRWPLALASHRAAPPAASACKPSLSCRQLVPRLLRSVAARATTPAWLPT